MTLRYPLVLNANTIQELQTGDTLNINGTDILSYTSAAYNKANNALANTSGTFAGDLIITGNLTVTGVSTTVNVNTEIINQSEVVTGRLTANSGQASTNTTSGSIVVLGGAGISGNVYAGAVYANGVQLTPGTTTGKAIAMALVFGF
jgi:hypothetical protein